MQISRIFPKRPKDCDRPHCRPRQFEWVLSELLNSLRCCFDRASDAEMMINCIWNIILLHTQSYQTSQHPNKYLNGELLLIKFDSNFWHLEQIERFLRCLGNFEWVLFLPTNSKCVFLSDMSNLGCNASNSIANQPTNLKLQKNKIICIGNNISFWPLYNST